MIRKATFSAFLLASLLTTPARAEEPPRVDSAWPRLVTVRAVIDYRDLDLGTPDGLAEARRRASRIVGDMCRPDPAPAGPGRGRIDGHCFREAMASARPQLEQVAMRQRNVQTALIGAARTGRED
ncbi:MAG: UrcA family protein [Allosphingosinicella sp.]